VFPLAFVPRQSWAVAPRSFGARRDRGRRKHAGCDLYAPVGTPVFTVVDGVVMHFGGFYLGTYALTIDHGDFIVRYGEVKKNLPPGLSVGARVRKGQKIAFVGKLNGLSISMLHFEMYSGTGTGPLTVRTKPPFMRRADLLDPTRRLTDWARQRLPTDR
jgi:murein DD-endopeptidase MepM/ murein hydrolase activator NlpD